LTIIYSFLICIKHRFASHVCETLFLQSLPIVSKEMDAQYLPTDLSADGDDDTIQTSMETLFLSALTEMLPAISELLTHTFASHTIRTLLLLLSGRPVSTVKNLVQSRKKENIPTEMGGIEGGDQIQVVPASFAESVGKVLEKIGECSTEELRSLAVHPTGSPALQVALQIEMGLDKKKRRAREKNGGTLLGRLTGISEKDGEPAAKKQKTEKTENDEADSEEKKEESAETATENSFFQNLLYDSVGSHLAESLIRTAPKREFNILYHRFISARLGSLARNETAAFVVQRVLEKLTATALPDAITQITPQIPGLVERNRVAVLKSLLDACAKHSIDSAPVVKAILDSYSSNKEELIFKILHITPEALKPEEPKAIAGKPKRDPLQLHGSLLAQSLMPLPGAEVIAESILCQPVDVLVGLCNHSTASHVVQALLKPPTVAATTAVSANPLPGQPNAKKPKAPKPAAPPAPINPILKKRLLNTLRGRFVELALNNVGSHIVDNAWDSPMNLRQSIAEELSQAEPLMRESYSGRAVWRNWGMDKYKTQRQRWFKIGKEEEEFGAKPQERKKTAIQLARERHAAKKDRGFGGATGTNGGALGPRGKRGFEEVEGEDGGKRQRMD
jgi:nucleolar protein 9